MKREIGGWLGFAAVLALLVAASVLLPTRPRTVSAQTHFNTCEQSSTTVTLLGATSGTSAVQLVAAASGEPIYVCAVTVVGVSGTTPTFSLVYGTGTNCGTGQHTFLGPITTTALAPYIWPGAYVGAVPAGNALCYLDGGTSPVQDYIVVYAQG